MAESDEAWAEKVHGARMTVLGYVLSLAERAPLSRTREEIETEAEAVGGVASALADAEL